jgi:simple sugar transport system permease protein
MTAVLRRGAPSAAALAIALLISGVVVALAGRNPVVAFSALVDGAFGSAYGLSEVGVKACPLLITGLAVAVAFRAGIWNIGAEGQLLAGATIMATIGSRPWPLPGWLALPLALLAAAGGGAAWAAAAGWLRVRRNVNEVISTIMLNFIALGIVGYLVHGPLQEAAGTYPQSDAIVSALRLPRVIGGTRLHAGLLLAVVAAVGCMVLLFRTVLGFQMRAVGLNAEAARLGGARPERCLLLALVISGALAGLAGAVEVSAVTFRLYERFSPGWGFTAIAVALLGRLHPAGIVGAALLFGVLEAGSNSMQRVADVSAVLVDVVQATVILCMLAVEQHAGWWRGAR